MAATFLGSLLISLGLESGQFKSGLDAAEKQVRTSAKRIEKIGANMATLGRNLTLGITLPLAAFGVASFKAASDAAELQSAFDQTFGDMSKSMNDWAEATGDAMGRSTQEIQQAANTFGIFFNTSAKTRGEAAELSKQFAVLAQDLSSFYNVDPTVALQKLRSGLSGESEPLRDFGVFLTEAAVASKAVELGLAKSTKEVSEQAKVMARASLIMDATKNAQGDVARTADGTANRIRAAKAAFEELQVSIGTKLLPVLTPLITSLSDILNVFASLPQSVQTGVLAFAGLAAVIGPLVGIIGAVTKAIAPMVASIRVAAATATAAGVATSGLSATLVALRVRVIALIATLGPWALAVAAVAGAIYLLTSRTEESAQATGKYKKAQEEASAASDKAASLAEKLATAHGKVRAEALAAAKAERENVKQKLASAQASLILAEAEAVRARSEARLAAERTKVAANDPRLIPGINKAGADRQLEQANANAKAAEEAVISLMGTKKRLDAIISAGPPSVAPVEAGDGKKAKKSKESKDRTDELAARAAQDLYNLQIEELRARSQLSQDVNERSDIEREILAKERAAREADLDAAVKSGDLTKEQAKAQRDILDLLYGKRDSEAKDGEILVESQKSLYGEQVERERRLQLFQDATDLAETQFKAQSDTLRLQFDLADTEAERKQIALDTLAAEDAYLRSKLKAVIANQDLAESVRKQAQIELDALNATANARRESVARSNETQVERYIRDLNKSPAQINEAVDQIKISGLQNLNDQLVDAAINFKSLGSVAKSVLQSILADLLRLQIQQAIIKPLAGLLGLGGGLSSGASGGLAAAGSILGGVKIPGFASGTNFAPGGLALVGEKGPELVNLPRGSQVIPNNELANMRGGSQIFQPTFVFPGVRTGADAREAGAQAARAFRQKINGPVRT